MSYGYVEQFRHVDSGDAERVVADFLALMPSWPACQG